MSRVWKFIKEQLRLGLIIACLLGLLYWLLNGIVRKIISLATQMGQLFVGGQWLSLGAGLVCMIVLILLIGITGHRFSVEKHASNLRRDNTLLRFMGFKTFIQKLKQGGRAFPWVTTPSSECADHRELHGVQITKMSSHLEESRVVCLILEPRNPPLGIKWHFIDEDAVEDTGKPGWELIKLTMFLGGVFQEEHENDESNHKKPE